MKTPIAYHYRIYNSFTDKVTDAFTISKDIALEYDQRPTPLYVNYWVPVTEELPKKSVLVCYVNSAGKKRRLKAFYVPKFTNEADMDYWDEEHAEYNEGDDTYYEAEGWYEECDMNTDFSGWFINDGKVTHWMALPEFSDV
jgi:hypothetical protein